MLAARINRKAALHLLLVIRWPEKRRNRYITVCSEKGFAFDFDLAG